MSNGLRETNPLPVLRTAAAADLDSLAASLIIGSAATSAPASASVTHPVVLFGSHKKPQSLSLGPFGAPCSGALPGVLFPSFFFFLFFGALRIGPLVVVYGPRPQG